MDMFHDLRNAIIQEYKVVGGWKLPTQYACLIAAVLIKRHMFWFVDLIYDNPLPVHHECKTVLRSRIEKRFYQIYNHHN
jgi:hypothetical protein